MQCKKCLTSLANKPLQMLSPLMKQYEKREALLDKEITTSGQVQPIAIDTDPSQ
jgi:hypothetical protein